MASGGWLCFFPENKFASQADIKAVHCVSDEVKRIEVKTQTPYAFKKMLSYPRSPAQLKKIDKVDEIWFVCTVDNKSRSDIREMTKQWEGHVYKVTSQEMKEILVSLNLMIKLDYFGLIIRLVEWRKLVK